jgi:excisionase family DNA binding protein
MQQIPDPETQPTMRVEEAAEILGIGRSAAYAAANTGELPVIRIGHRCLVPVAALRRMLLLDDTPAPNARPDQ